MRVYRSALKHGVAQEDAIQAAKFHLSRVVLSYDPVVLSYDRVVRKTMEFPWATFPAEVVNRALESFIEVIKSTVKDPAAVTPMHDRLMVRNGRVTWDYASLDEFYGGLRAPHTRASLGVTVQTPEPTHSNFAYEEYTGLTEVSVSLAECADVERVMAPFEDSTERYTQPPPPEPPASAPVVFIGHGRSGVWRDLKDHLVEKHGYAVKAYETGARAGHTIRDILEDTLQESSFAVLVMTAEDEQADGSLHARPNVIHEAGLFQGRLGFGRAIILLEGGATAFSNIDGVQYIPFTNIAETYGEVLATLKREFV